jgi:hypothetical protein
VHLFFIARATVFSTFRTRFVAGFCSFRLSEIFEVPSHTKHCANDENNRNFALAAAMLIFPKSFLNPMHDAPLGTVIMAHDDVEE